MELMSLAMAGAAAGGAVGKANAEEKAGISAERKAGTLVVQPEDAEVYSLLGGGEARLLLMAALVLSDELHDLREQRGITAQPAGKSDPKVGRRLRGIAKRAEAIADSAEALPLTAEPDTKLEHAETIAATSEPT